MILSPFTLLKQKTQG